MIDWKGLVLPGIVSAVVSGAIAGPFTYVTENQVNKAAEQRASKLARALEFSSSDGTVTSLAASYLQAVAAGKDLSEIRINLKSELGKEARNAERLQAVFSQRTEPAFDAYRASLSAFSNTLESAASPVEMRSWVEAFGQMNDRRRELAKALGAEAT